MSLDLTDDKSTLVQVMAWCRQTTSHYLSQCWPRSMSLNGVTRSPCPQSSHSCVVQHATKHFISLQWRHNSHLASRITSNSTFCSTVCSVNIKENIEVPYYWFWYCVESTLPKMILKDEPMSSHHRAIYLFLWFAHDQYIAPSKIFFHNSDKDGNIDNRDAFAGH